MYILKDTIHKSIAESIYNDIFTGRVNYYYFSGKILEWANALSPDTPVLTQSYEYNTRNDIIAVKKVNSNDVSLVIPRRDWASGTVYDQYDGEYSASSPASSGATSLKTSKFYVLTDDFNVYKCLFNKNGAQSTSKPFGMDATSVTYADGYVWKFMYKIPLSSRNKFMTTEYMPVQRSVTNSFYSNGEISSIVIDAGGSGYSNSTVTLTLTGDGANANLRAFVNDGTGQLSDIVINNRGEGYTYLNIQVNGGSNANAHVNLSSGDLNTLQSVVELSAVNGGVHAIRVTHPGNNYTYANVSLAGDGSNFIGNVVLVNNSISYITVTSPGSNYTFANVVITGNGSNANATAIISPYGGHGKDAVTELFANSVLLYSTMNNEKLNGVVVRNNFRQYGLLRDVRQFANSRVHSNITGSACFLVTLNNTTSLVADRTLVITKENVIRNFNVVEVVGSSNQVLLTNKNNYTLAKNDVLTDNVTSLSYTIASIDKNPDINKFSGDLVFINNRTSVNYNSQQAVALKSVIKV